MILSHRCQRPKLGPSHEPVEPPRLPQPGAAGGRRRGPGRARLLPRLPAALPRRPARLAAPLRGAVRPVGRLRRRRQAGRLRRLRALPEVVALRQRPRLPPDLPRGRRRQRDPRRLLRRRQAVRAHPAALGRGDGLRPHDDADRRRPARGAADRRAALARRRASPSTRCWWSAPAPAARWSSASCSSTPTSAPTAIGFVDDDPRKRGMRMLGAEGARARPSRSRRSSTRPSPTRW